mgnify:CR=1 FL=1
MRIQSHILGLCAGLMVLPHAAQSGAFSEAVQAARSGQAAQAVQMFRHLANDRNGAAQFNLAVMYARGQGVPQSDELALYWGWRARFSGVDKADVLTGYLSRGATQNLLEKVQRRLHDDLIKSVNEGHRDAMLSLGRVYLELTDPSDPEQALVWFTIAAALQEPNAHTWRDVVARELDRETRLSAQERAASLYQQWCEGHSDQNPNICSIRS